MANQDWHKIPELEGRRVQTEEQLPAQRSIPASSRSAWWGWIWFVVVIVVFVWLLGWGW